MKKLIFPTVLYKVKTTIVNFRKALETLEEKDQIIADKDQTIAELEFLCDEFGKTVFFMYFCPQLCVEVGSNIS